jgi:hypothetical protein
MPLPGAIKRKHDKSKQTVVMLRDLIEPIFLYLLTYFGIGLF